MRAGKWLAGILLFFSLVLAACSYQVAYGSLNGGRPAALHRPPPHRQQVAEPAVRRQSRRHVSRQLNGRPGGHRDRQKKKMRPAMGRKFYNDGKIFWH
ncbi:hypothetical protein [Desulfotomaculum copahuensis]|uniref:Uncharacterized protein n=1 Tax=Desulfotomaculum copahuensis TaxID=1838280 RepID=A0A1B7LEF8_9FIRM|nr:hypothetical protein [Desulfotomaculum copahuensis]OAT81435.1 hypothetical protein A6M21_11240 [Desulfotomaculum copahuensis]